MKHFQLSEFACGCGCGQMDMDSAFLDRLDKARDLAGVPFVITDGGGFRCRRYNAEIGGVEDSAHTWCVAADIAAASSERRFHILRGLILAGFRRIGVGSDFIHADTDDDKPQDVIWTY